MASLPLYITPELYEDLTALVTSYLDPETGAEINNPKPMYESVGSGLSSGKTLQERIRMLLRTEFSRQVASQGAETFEESSDFDVDDGFDGPERFSKYQLVDEDYPISPPRAAKTKPEASFPHDQTTAEEASSDSSVSSVPASPEPSALPVSNPAGVVSAPTGTPRRSVR